MGLLSSLAECWDALRRPAVWMTPDGYVYDRNRTILEQPHMLIGGSTGSGKSVALNALIYDLTTMHSPATAELYFVDCKRVEFSAWERLPHTVTIARSRAEALTVLQAVSGRMEARYTSLQRRGLRRWDSSAIYVIVDELADLTLTQDSKLRRALLRQLQHIAELGRAANIHLVLATQAPSRKSIPAEIALNITARMALHCDSAIESRQIIGVSGAELLPLYGDGLFKIPGREICHYTKLPIVSDAAIAERVEFYRAQMR